MLFIVFLLLAACNGSKEMRDGSSVDERKESDVDEMPLETERLEIVSIHLMKRDHIDESFFKDKRKEEQEALEKEKEREEEERRQAEKEAERKKKEEAEEKKKVEEKKRQEESKANKEQKPKNTDKATKKKQKDKSENQKKEAKSFVDLVIDLTNAERQKNGLPALKKDANLMKSAQAKSVDMYENNYFAHESPSGESPFDLMKKHGVTYRTAGENIAQGHTTPESVVTAWMNSPGHRDNILNADFTHIGVGEKERHWTQQFTGN